MEVFFTNIKNSFTGLKFTNFTGTKFKIKKIIMFHIIMTVNVVMEISKNFPEINNEQQQMVM